MKITRRTNIAVYGTGIILASICSLIMISWFVDWRPIFQVRPDFVPMAFNTALCHFLCAISLLTVQNRKWLSITAACLAALFALTVGSQYLIGKNFGIDSFFVEASVHTRSSYPGRMAPNTVLYFFLSVIGLLSWHIKKHELRLMSLMAIGLILLLLSLIVLIGYIVKVEATYSWWGLSDMAPLTAICFLLISIGFLGLAYKQSHIERDQKIRFLPSIFTATAGITITLLVVQGLLINDRNRMQELAIEQSSKMSHIIGLEMKNDILALARMQSRLNTLDKIDIDAWRRDAMNYVQDNPAYKVLGLIDKNFNIYGNVSSDNKTFFPDTSLSKSILTQASQSDQLSSYQFDINYKEKFIIFLLPLKKNNLFNGFLIAAYDIQEELSHLPTSKYNPDAYFEILNDNKILYTNKDQHDFIWKFTHDNLISFNGLNWTIRETINNSNPTNKSIVILILIAGTTLSLSLARAKWQNERIRIYSENIKSSEDRYARTTSAAQVGLWDWDLIDHKLVWAGNAWELFGAKSNAHICSGEEELLSMIPEEDRALVRAQVLDSISKNESFTVDYRTKTMNGREIWVQSRGRVVAWKDGEPTCISGTLTDITKQKNSEYELRRTNHELERFAYVASHDLKAPLRNIDNLAKWVIEDNREVLPEDAQIKLDLLRGRVGRLERLLDDILAYSRAGRIVDTPVTIDTKELVNVVAQSTVPNTFMVLTTDPMPSLVSPRTPLEQVLGNIFSNSVKHHDREAGIITVSAKETGNFYEFIVNDDGPGIPPEFHERVFEMFQTLQPRDKIDSSGMGMAIIKKLVEWNQGRVWIESNHGVRGTTIHFLWPKVILPSA